MFKLLNAGLRIVVDPTHEANANTRCRFMQKSFWGLLHLCKISANTRASVSHEGNRE